MEFGKDAFRAALLFIFISAFLCSCGGTVVPPAPQDDPDPPETQPTPILGSGLNLFTYSQGAITCTTNYNNNQNQVQCVAEALPSSSASSAGESQVTVTSSPSYTQADGFDPSITSHVWQPLQATVAATLATPPITFSISDMQVSTDGITVVYTMPEWLSQKSLDFLATLLVGELNAQGATLQENVQTTFGLNITSADE
jgi:hypothetical protein